ncbi:MAG: hypothetical protein JKY49_03755 [Cohaesibacteraceae bacterium]|nr:hypothetical protein [Cohaesibacteraceae bacterium]MBL4875559.1 hypothetical protein [Cohaesibacteraceae bacterium]
MRISGPYSSPSVKPSKRKGKTSSSGERFEIGKDTASGHTEGLSGPMSVGSVNSLLALQEVDEVAEKIGRSVAWGSDLLDSMDAIQAGILAGGLTLSEVQKLKQLVEHRSKSVDERLESIMDEIDLRAQVELAKLEMNKKTR